MADGSAPAPKPARCCGRCIAAHPAGHHGWPQERATAAQLAMAGRARYQCRARPPVLIAHHDDEAETLWPMVLGEDWCMGFKAAAVVKAAA